MTLSDEQRGIVESCLRLDDLGETDGPTITVELTKRETRLLVEALDRFRETSCPLAGKGEECALLFWSENAQNGALDRACIGGCERLVTDLLGDRTQRSFAPRRR